MNFNDPDPGGVKALLERLRGSQTFNDVVKASSDAADPPTSSSSSSVPASQQKPSVVSSLLALLGPSPSSPQVYQQRTVASAVSDAPPPPTSNRLDFRSMTYQQALHYLGELSAKQDFLDSIRKMKDEQDRFERNLWEERAGVIERHEDKVKAAKTKAVIVNPNGELSVKEQTILARTLEKDLQDFYADTVLPAWDALVTKQQEALEALHVPTMFPTEVSTDRTRQQRVLQVLEGFQESKP